MSYFYLIPILGVVIFIFGFLDFIGALNSEFFTIFFVCIVVMVIFLVFSFVINKREKKNWQATWGKKLKSIDARIEEKEQELVHYQELVSKQ